MRTGSGHPSLEAQFVDVERRAVAVHEHHGRGEVEDARGQYTETGSGVEEVAGSQPWVIEIVATTRQHERWEDC